MITSKKVRAVGTENYINQATGEIKEMQVIEVEERDFNFHKVWLSHLLNCMDLIGSKKSRVAYWVIDNLNSDNMLVKTQEEISEALGISIETVRITLRALVDCKFLVRKCKGVYIVNPNIIFKGSHNKRMSVMVQYSKTTLENEKKELKKNMEKAPAEDILQEVMK